MGITIGEDTMGFDVVDEPRNGKAYITEVIDERDPDLTAPPLEKRLPRELPGDIAKPNNN